jgi:hypothetical protein
MPKRLLQRGIIAPLWFWTPSSSLSIRISTTGESSMNNNHRIHRRGPKLVQKFLRDLNRASGSGTEDFATRVYARTAAGCGTISAERPGGVSVPAPAY